STTTTSTRTGTIMIRTKGLTTSAPVQPTITSSVPALINKTSLSISGTKEANTSILINGVEVVARNTATTWTVAASLAAEGNNALAITSKNSIGAVSLANTLTILRDTIIPTGAI